MFGNGRTILQLSWLSAAQTRFRSGLKQKMLMLKNMTFLHSPKRECTFLDRKGGRVNLQEATVQRYRYNTHGSFGNAVRIAEDSSGTLSPGELSQVEADRNSEADVGTGHLGWRRRKGLRAREERKRFLVKDRVTGAVVDTA